MRQRTANLPRNTPAPPAKWQLRTHLLGALYKQIEEERDAKLLDIIERNRILLQENDMKTKGEIDSGHYHPSFAYNGEHYTFQEQGIPPIRNKLHPTLVPEMKEWEAYYKIQILTEEQIRISGFLDSVFSFSSAPGDWLAVLPDSFAHILRSVTITESWEPRCTAEQHEAFRNKHKARFDLIRQRMAFNLIS